VRCPLETIMARREASPPRSYATAPEPVRRWQEAVHVPGVYDLEVDTSQLTPDACAAAIRRRLDDPEPPTAFARLAGG
jgi:chloramphenicol 3-O phosphotransferase